MLNMIRMELYRMFCTKSLYVIWIILAAAIVFTTSLTADEMKSYTMEEKQEQYEYATGQKSDEQTNIGMMVTISTKPGEDVTVFDLFYANLTGKFIALFMVIFAVLYSSADMMSGFVKNVAGQIGDRGGLVFAKSVSLFVYSVFTILLFALVQAISNGMYFDKFVWGSGKEFLLYGGIQILLHFAYVMIAMCLTIILRNNVISIVAVICMCMNVLIIFYGFIDKLVGKTGIEDFHVLNYTVSGKMTSLPMNVTVNAAATSSAVGAAFAVAAVMIS